MVNLSTYCICLQTKLFSLVQVVSSLKSLTPAQESRVWWGSSCICDVKAYHAYHAYHAFHHASSPEHICFRCSRRMNRNLCSSWHSNQQARESISSQDPSGSLCTVSSHSSCLTFCGIKTPPFTPSKVIELVSNFNCQKAPYSVHGSSVGVVCRFLREWGSSCFSTGSDITKM